MYYNPSSSYLGNVYIGDRSNCRIRKVTMSTGIITTFAGTGTCSYSGDGVQATSAALSYPLGVALDSAGISLLLYYLLTVLIYSFYLDNVYIVDEINNRIRKVTMSTATYTPR